MLMSQSLLAIERSGVLEHRLGILKKDIPRNLLLRGVKLLMDWLVSNPVPGEPLGLLFFFLFIVTLHFINHLEQFITVSSPGSQQGADFNVKPRTSRPCDSPGPGMGSIYLG